MRIGLGLVLLCDVLPKWRHVVELYSTDGTPLPVFPGSVYEPPAVGAVGTIVVYMLLVYALFAVMAGFKTRFSLVLAFVLFTWLAWLDFPGTYKKYSVISQHLLVLMAFTQSHAAWSIDALLDRESRTRSQLSPVWPRTLMCMLLSFIYFGAVVTKIRLADFGTGDLLTFSLLDVRWGGGRLGLWLSTMPALMMVLSYLTVLFELSAVTLLWVPQVRRWMLLLAIGFHASLGVTLHIGIFSPLMVVVLLAFLRESDLALLKRVLRRRENTEEASSSRFERFKETGSKRVWSWYAATAVLVIAIGLIQQYAADYGQAFSANKVPQWKELDATTVAGIKTATPADGAAYVRMNHADYFHRIDIGNRLGYPLVFGKNDSFTSEDTIFVLARLQRQHPDMKLVWRMTGPGGTSETERTLTSQFSHAWIGFQLNGPNTPPGKYTLILEANGEEVARRRFKLVSGD